MAVATTTCIKKNWKYPGGCGNARGMHHHYVLSDNYHLRYFDKVGMCYFHRPCNKSYCSTVSTDHLWSLDPDDVKKPAIVYDSNSTCLAGVTPFSYFKILRWGALTGQFRY
ncbi:large ribosomal subunit protein uL15y-like [Elaeis guineensis]|uniref:60S ribosomal protein L27a-2-like n=1 Tax=Elaeis guineensis var. tenera TaxID=51953 RepID=A0A6I9QMX8_ELAGV|nr:60S ribosomal protein L27a-2-like [Elaeis guineensis]